MTKKVIKFVLYIVFLIAAVYYTPKILSRTLHTEYPLASITSGSMWPALKQNDLILVKGITGAEAEIGQIIIFKNPKGFTIHRLIRKEKGKLITKGDANNVEDQAIEEEDVIGRVVYIKSKPFRIPKLGFIAQTLGSKLQQAIN
jgi:signal peptidase I